MSDSKKKDKKEKDFEGVRHTATRTEVLTGTDLLANRLLQQAHNSELSLIVVQGEMQGRVFRLKEGDNSIGRTPNSDISIPQRNVSSYHAKITCRAGAAVLEDLNSRNGTIKNQSPVTGPVILQPGDLIKIGSCVLRYTDKKVEAELAESLHNKATVDALTGVYNKAYLLQQLKSSMDVAKTGYPLSLIIFDLDHFKRVNDTWGHVAGDYVLKETCRVIKNSVVRAEDIFGRYGGEEFVVLMLHAPLATAAEVAERIRQTLENHLFEWEGQRIPVTASLGVSQWSPKHITLDDFVDEADELLYKSKQGGRNRVSS